MASGGCDPKVVKKGEEVIKKWFKKGGVINQNLGDKSFPYLKQSAINSLFNSESFLIPLYLSL